MKLILGSTSSARNMLLKQLGLEFFTKSPQFDERSLSYDGNPVLYAKDLAYLKNQSIEKSSQDLVLTCDTIVFCDNQVLNKPESYQDAVRMLKMLSGSTHEVITGMCLASNDKLFTSHESTKVVFHKLSDSQIEKFLQDPAYISRAGAYTLTGKGALLIKSIEGSYENVIGLSFNVLSSLLNHWQISLWD